MNIDYLWNRGEEKDWLQLLKCYKQSLKRCSLELDDNLDEILDISVRKMDGREFYSFIYNDYFGWKHSDCRWRESIRTKFEKVYGNTEGKGTLESIKDDFFNVHDLNPTDTRKNITALTKMSYIGVISASGILSILYPEYYGTIDKYIILELNSVKKYYEEIDKEFNPNNVKVSDAVSIERIYRNKADELNRRFGTGIWTPRKIDKVLWTLHYCQRKKCDKECEK